MDWEFTRIIRIRFIRCVHLVVIHIGFTTTSLLIVLFKERRIHTHRHHRHIHRFSDKVRIRHHFLGQQSLLKGSTAQHHVVINSQGFLEFRRTFRRDRTVLRATHLHSFRKICRRIQGLFGRVETTFRTTKGKLRSDAVISSACRIRLFRRRLIKVLPFATINNAPAHARRKFRIVHRVADSIIRVNQINGTAILF